METEQPTLRLTQDLSQHRRKYIDQGNYTYFCVGRRKKCLDEATSLTERVKQRKGHPISGKGPIVALRGRLFQTETKMKKPNNKPPLGGTEKRLGKQKNLGAEFLKVRGGWLHAYFGEGVGLRPPAIPWLQNIPKKKGSLKRSDNE